MMTPWIDPPLRSLAAGFIRQLSQWAVWRRLRKTSLREGTQGPRRPTRAMEVVVDVERIRLPAGAGNEQCIAEIEEHLRGSRDLRAPFAHAPKQVGPFG